MTSLTDGAFLGMCWDTRLGLMPVTGSYFRVVVYLELTKTWLCYSFDNIQLCSTVWWRLSLSRLRSLGEPAEEKECQA